VSPADRPLSEARLESRINRAMAVRLGVALVCLTAVMVFETGLRAFSPQPHYVVLTAACVVNLGYMIAVRWGANLRRVAVLQLVTDVVMVTALVYLVGPQRWYVLLYFLVVIGGAALMGLRSAMAVALQSTLFLGGVAALYYSYGDIGLWMVEKRVLEDTDKRIGFLASYAAFCGVGLFAVAFLAGKLSEEAREARIINDEILQNMAGGVVAVDRLGSIVYANEQARGLLSMRNGATGEEYGRALPREVAALFQRAISGGERVKEEIVVGGRPVEIAISHLGDGRLGNIRGVVAMVNDLSLRSEIEKVTEQAGRFRALLEMSAGIAHEIRNPIASIRGAAQELQTARFPDPDDKKLLDVVMRESDRLDKIISDFLEYASDRPIQTSLVNLSELLQEVATLLEARDTEKKMTIELQTPRTIVVRGAPDKLKQVFLNLGVNALESVRRGGRLTIRCIAQAARQGPARDGALVEFVDDGTGIAVQNLERIFDPFFTTKPKGTGMGLAIARKIVQEHGGTIVAENVQPFGARFNVWLPAD
jgi:signal transduction histidine kinase